MVVRIVIVMTSTRPIENTGYHPLSSVREHVIDQISNFSDFMFG